MTLFYCAAAFLFGAVVGAMGVCFLVGGEGGRKRGNR